ncbi:MAG: FAD-dependent monooxygenase [Pelagibacterales bacterium]|nr:FAD-dependent monooxygenase [Pelagibacterales bacterium]
MKNIAILGDSLIGLLSALVLSKNKNNIYIFRNIQEDSERENIERYFSINLLSKYMFMKSGIWENIKPDGIQPYKKIITWNDTGNEVTFNSRSISYDYLGYIIKESSIKKAIEEKLSKLKNVIIKSIEEVSYINQSESNVINFKNKKKLKYDLLLLADARNFNIFNNLEINRITHNYNQSALVINLKLENSISEKVAFQRFADSQIQGLLPISSNEFNLIWSINSSEVDNLFNKDKTSLIKILNNQLSSRIGNIIQISDRIIFPLSGFYVKSYVYNNIILIGGSAHSVHPLAGLGLNMGIQDIFILDTALNHEKNTYINEKSLNYYNSSCIKNNKKIFYTINFLKKFYENEFLSLSVKSKALDFFDKSLTLKSQVIEEATGIKTLNSILSEGYSRSNNY